METTLEFTCVGMGYADRRKAVELFWRDVHKLEPVENGLCLSYYPTNPYDSDAIAVVYCPDWMGLNAPKVGEILSSDVEDDQCQEFIIGYVTKDDIPCVNDFLLTLEDELMSKHSVIFSIEEIREKDGLPTWMRLSMDVEVKSL